jgi:hypothetical protein
MNSFHRTDDVTQHVRSTGTPRPRSFTSLIIPLKLMHTITTLQDITDVAQAWIIGAVR